MNKYRNVKTRVGDKVFDSRKEAARYILLRDMEKQGKIMKLLMQVKYPVVVSDVKICTYIADFRYVEINPTGKNRLVVEDVKSEITRKNPVYRIKKKLVEALYSIVITEV
jgi:hypothetical protein